MAKPEHKYFDTVLSTQAGYGSAATTNFASGLWNGTTSWITAITQGVAGNQRLGDSVVVTSVQYRLTLILDSTKLQQYFRLFVFADEELEGVQPTFANIFQYATIATGALESPLSPGYFGRWKILHDEVIALTSVSAVAMERSHVIEKYHDLSNCRTRGHQIMWTPPNGDNIANALKGHIFVYAMYYDQTQTSGVSAQATANPPTMQGIVRVRYVDN